VSLFNGLDQPDNPLFFISPAETIQGAHRQAVEAWLAQVPGVQRVQIRIDGASQTFFETTGNGVKRLYEILPRPEMKGLFIVRLGRDVKDTLSPAT
jgi:hypothetical protein